MSVGGYREQEDLSRRLAADRGIPPTSVRRVHGVPVDGSPSRCPGESLAIVSSDQSEVRRDCDLVEVVASRADP